MYDICYKTVIEKLYEYYTTEGAGKKIITDYSVASILKLAHESWILNTSPNFQTQKRADCGKIHLQAQIIIKDNQNVYVQWLKEEKGIPRGGRDLDELTPAMQEIFDIVRGLHEANQVESPYIFAKKDGTYVTPKVFESALEKMCKKLGFSITNNHSIRKYVNSYVLEPEGLPVANRARWLGHLAAVNFENYSLKVTEVSTTQAARDALFRQGLGM